MKVSFELSASDIRYFRDRLEKIRQSETTRDEPVVIRLAKDLVAKAVQAEPPEFVRERLLRLDQLAEILGDEEWRLEGRDRARILDALAYFVDPDDMISDRIPGIGYLDDAIMIEMIVQELKHDIKAYEDFCAVRKKRASGEVLEAQRSTLQSRMRRRRHRDRQLQRDRSGKGRSPFRLW